MSMSGAEYLASIYGTEKDKVNCSFYIKTGACRHSERCSRKHNKPQYRYALDLILYRKIIINVSMKYPCFITINLNFNSKMFLIVPFSMENVSHLYY